MADNNETPKQKQVDIGDFSLKGIGTLRPASEQQGTSTQDQGNKVDSGKK